MRQAMVCGGLIAVLMAGCTTDPYTGQRGLSRTGQGALIGTATGAGLGALIGGDRKGALIGGAAGAALGAGVGVYMDRQQRKLQEQLAGTGVEVQRQGDNLVLQAPSNSQVNFAYNSAQITPQAASVLSQIGATLNQFPETLVTVAGHTDSDGSDAYNLDLSRRRADSVVQFLSSQGVNYARLQAMGYGESQPIASNASEAGKAQNRRVEILIRPNPAAQQPPAPQGQNYPPPAGAPVQTGYPPPQPYPYGR